ncbi:type 1 fimbrial protein [Proteus hauseri]|uniref:fimbrial protein n=1 Tax=Proteus cibi TaxID=2050966 RepID=UPI0003C5973E|nr:fimbrial protein [Proteus hauseri]EST57342.1 hypothetical protein K151_2747 [Proteus hauseri ZMd44]MBG6030540.1 type 1 fimbrial protein [Proteus hauseri]MBS6209742.1 type 1 fimbrial protein [Proteus hauseri]
MSVSKKVVSKLLIAGLLASSFSTLALDTSGKVLFQGYIYSATCEVDINGQGPNSAIIEMGRYSTSEFSGTDSEVGGTGGKGQIKISLINCPDKGTLSVKFSGKPEANNNEILSLLGDNSADGVGIHLYKANDLTTPLTIDGSKTLTYNIGDEENQTPELHVSLVAKYVATQDKVTAGDGNSEMDYTIQYN